MNEGEQATGLLKDGTTTNPSEHSGTHDPCFLPQHEKTVFEGHAGGDRIVATVNLKGELMHLKAAPELWGESHEVILDFIRSAVRQATAKAHHYRHSKKTAPSLAPQHTTEQA